MTDPEFSFARPPVSPELGGTIVQREVLHRLALGAAHTWNNALTSILGEIRNLQDARGADPLVAGACVEIEREASRCAQLTRALQSRANWRQGAPGNVELGALARRLAPLLRETTSRSFAISWELPAESLWAHARPEASELLLLLAAQRLVHDAPNGAALRLTLAKAVPPHADVRIEWHAPASSVRSDPHPPTAWDTLLAASAHALAADSGIRWIEDPSGRCLRLRFELAAEAD